MDKIRIVRLNVHGLNNGLKRRKVFRYLKSLKADLCLLQETYDLRTMTIWQSEWGNKCLFAHGTNRSCGVAMLFSKK